MARRPLKKKKPSHSAIEWVQLAIGWTVCVFLASKLAFMNFDGLFTLTGIVLGLMIAFTGLMYNRARAYPEGKIQRRSILAAETGLKAVCFTLVALAVGGLIFYVFALQGVKPLDGVSVYQQRPLLYFGAAIPSAFAFVAIAEIFNAMNLVVPQVVREKSTKVRLRGMQSKPKSSASSTKEKSSRRSY